MMLLADGDKPCVLAMDADGFVGGATSGQDRRGGLAVERGSRRIGLNRLRVWRSTRYAVGRDSHSAPSVLSDCHPSSSNFRYERPHLQLPPLACTLQVPCHDASTYCGRAYNQ